MSISANIICANEAYWIGASISSIIDLVDELIIVDDQSSDRTLEIAQSFSSKKIRIYSFDDHKIRNLGDLKNFGVQKSTSTHIVRWDADFVAFDSLHQPIEFLQKNHNQYDVMQLSGPNLAGTIDFCPSDKLRFGAEIYMAKKEFITFEATERYSDMPTHPANTKFCKLPVYRNGNFFIHGNSLKPLEKLAMRIRMSEWNRSRTALSYWQWLAIKENLTELDAKEEAIEKIARTPVSLTPYASLDLPEVPDLIKTSDLITKSFKLNEVDNQFFLKYPRYINE